MLTCFTLMYREFGGTKGRVSYFMNLHNFVSHGQKFEFSKEHASTPTSINTRVSLLVFFNIYIYITYFFSDEVLYSEYKVFTIRKMGSSLFCLSWSVLMLNH